MRRLLFISLLLVSAASVSGRALAMAGVKAGADSVMTVTVRGIDSACITDKHCRVAQVPIVCGGHVYHTHHDKGNMGKPVALTLPSGAAYTIGQPHCWTGYECVGIDSTDRHHVVVKVAQKTGFEGTRYLFYSPLNAYPGWRIPAIVTARNGDVLAFSDQRYSFADVGMGGKVDIFWTVSRDGGSSWSVPQVAAKSKGVIPVGANRSDTLRYSYGDVALCADRESDSILIVHCAGNKSFFNSTESQPLRQVRYYAAPDDRGQWLFHNAGMEDTIADVSRYELTDNLLHQTLGDCCKSCFFTSGRMLQSSHIKVGTHYRVYAALDAIIAPTATSTEYVKGNVVVYSDDFGYTWQLLGGLSEPVTPCVVEGDEAKLAELSDGSVIISSRKYHGRYFNVFCYSDPGRWTTGVWGQTIKSESMPGGISVGANSTNGELLVVPARRRSDGARVSVALHSLPLGEGRCDLGIFWKVLDEPTSQYNTPEKMASHWSGPFRVQQGYAAYSTMTPLSDGRIGLFFEDYAPAVNLGTYDQCFVPLSLDLITKGECVAE